MTTTAPHLESILRPTKLAIVLFAISNAGLSEYMGTVGNLSPDKYIAILTVVCQHAYILDVSTKLRIDLRLSNRHSRLNSSEDDK